VEEQFYFVFPLLMLALRRTSKKILLTVLATLVLISLAGSIWMEFHLDPSWNFYLPVSRAWELGIGVLLGITQDGRLGLPCKESLANKLIAILGLGMILASYVFYTPGMKFPGYEALLPTVGAALVIAGGAGVVKKLLSWRPINYIGVISYSIYLWHWPVISFAHVFSGARISWETATVLMACAFTMAIVSYHLIETPIRAGFHPRTPTFFLSYASVLLGLVAIGGVFAFSGLSSRDPGLAQIEARANLRRKHGCLKETYDRLPAQCTLTDQTAAEKVALIGDSHAEAVSAIFKERLVAKNLKLVVMTHPRCPATLGYTRWIPGGETASCRKFNERVLNELERRSDIRTVILLAGWAGREYIPDGAADVPDKDVDRSFSYLAAGLSGEVNTLLHAGKRIVVMDDFPEYGFDPLSSYYYGRIQARQLLNRLILAPAPPYSDDYTVPDESTLNWDSGRRVEAQMAGMAARDPRIAYVPSKEAFCNAGKCIFGDAQDAYYYDGDHVSDSGAALIWDKLIGRYFQN
jgi:hypothetical protein